MSKDTKYKAYSFGEFFINQKEQNGVYIYNYPVISKVLIAPKEIKTDRNSIVEILAELLNSIRIHQNYLKELAANVNALLAEKQQTTLNL